MHPTASFSGIPPILAYLFVFVAAFPFIYYVIAIYSAWNYFRGNRLKSSRFTPPVSNLKPIRGLDPGAYENFASLCRQDYPEYELLFCVGSESDPAVPVLKQLIEDFPDRAIRIFVEDASHALNDKVAKLARLVREARYETLVINDSDVRVEPDYFRRIVAPLEDAAVGGVTCFYTSLSDSTFADSVHTAGMFSDFYAGLLVAKQLDGVKFAIGKTIATTRSHLARFGGYEALQNRPGDDLLVGRLIAAEGLDMTLLRYVVNTTAGNSSFGNMLRKRLRWLVVMRHLRPSGHFGLLFTHGLAWTVLILLLHPGAAIATAFVLAYVFLRLTMTWLIAAHGLQARGAWKGLVLFPIWDATAFCLWLASFVRSNIRWRGGQYAIRNGELVPAAD